MKCPFCGHGETQVVETRVSEDGDFIRRRRQCGACDKRFTTYERPDVAFPAIAKKDGRRIEYDRAKLLASFDQVGERTDPRVLARQADATVFAPDAITEAQAATYWTSIDTAIHGLDRSVGLGQRLRGRLSVRSFRRYGTR